MTRIDHVPHADHPLRRPLVIALLLALAITVAVAAPRGGVATSDPATAVPDVAAAAAAAPAPLSPPEALEVYDVYLDVARYAAAHDLRGLSPVSLERLGGVPLLP